MNIRDISRKLRANLSFFFNENERSYLRGELKIIKKINQKADKIKFSKKNKLSTHQLFSRKILNIIKNKQLLNFLQLGFIQQMFFIHNRLFIIIELIELRLDKEWKLWRKLIEENKIGNPVRYFLYPKSSGNKIHQVYHLKKYKNFSKIDFKKFDNIIEFGGGYGNMATIFYKINSKLNYYIFDQQNYHSKNFY